MAKYIFVTGGVVSSLGKGITAASLGRLLKSRGLKVTIQKFDPYINIDPGTMSPYQHGEVFVTDDGAETDLRPQITDKFNLRSVMSPTSAIATIEMIIVGAITATILRKFAERETLYRNIYRASFLLVLPLANTFTNSNVHVLSILSGYILTYVYLDISQQRSDATVDTEDDDQFSVATNAATYLGRQKDTTAITMIVANNTSVASFKNSSPKSRVRNKRKKTKKWRQLRMLRRRSKRSRH